MDLISVDLGDGRTITLGALLGQGSFGLVRRGVISPGDVQVAVKLEELTKHHRYLPHEAHILADLKDLPGVPRLHGFTVTDDYNVLVMELLGESLNEKFKKCGRTLSHSTILRLFDELIEVLEGLHRHGYVHRDIKPHNFLTSSSEKVYIIDFGLSKKMYEVRSGRRRKGIVGTLPFVSLNMHLGLPATRRDDLEALAFMLIYLAKGTLPWYDPRKKKMPEPQVRTLKEDEHLADLCSGLPPEIHQYLTRVRSLHAEEVPNYTALRLLFTTTLKTLASPQPFDWLMESSGLQKRLTVEHGLIRLYSNQYSPQPSGSDQFSQLRETQETPIPFRGIDHLRRKSSERHSESTRTSHLRYEVPQDSGIAEDLLRDYLRPGEPASKARLKTSEPSPAPRICLLF